MTAPIAMRCSYSDFRLVKTRSVAQVVLEIDIARAEEFVTAFGLPIGGEERPVGLALLNPEGGEATLSPGEKGISNLSRLSNGAPAAEQSAGSGGVHAEVAPPETSPRRAWDTLSAQQQAGIRCADQQFQEWLLRESPDQSRAPIMGSAGEWERWAIAEIRLRCNIISRREFATDDLARARWAAIDTSFRQRPGQVAEQR